MLYIIVQSAALTQVWVGWERGGRMGEVGRSQTKGHWCWNCHLLLHHSHTPACVICHPPHCWVFTLNCTIVFWSFILWSYSTQVQYFSWLTKVPPLVRYVSNNIYSLVYSTFTEEKRFTQTFYELLN